MLLVGNVWMCQLQRKCMALPEFIRVNSGHQSGLIVDGIGQVLIGQSQVLTISSASSM